MKPMKPKGPAGLTPRVKVWFEAADGYGFGAGLVAILQAVERAGSIKAAAAELGRSYRHIWDRVKEAERAVGVTLVETHVGGQGTQRSALTPDGRRVVADFLRLRAAMIEALERLAQGDD
jgi:molybdate transport system regulatory protein